MLHCSQDADKSTVDWDLPSNPADCKNLGIECPADWLALKLDWKLNNLVGGRGTELNWVTQSYGPRGAGIGLDLALCLVGLVGGDYAMIAADMNAGRSIMVFNQEADRIMEMDSHKLLGVCGDPADCVNEPEFFQKNLNLYALRNAEKKLSTHATANYMRGEKSANLRKGMKQVDMLLCGFDEGKGLALLHRLPRRQKLNVAGHGYGGMSSTGARCAAPRRAAPRRCAPRRCSPRRAPPPPRSLARPPARESADAHWKEGMTEEEGMHLMKLCIAEINTRFMINMPNWVIKVVDKNGVRTLRKGPAAAAPAS